MNFNFKQNPKILIYIFLAIISFLQAFKLINLLNLSFILGVNNTIDLIIMALILFTINIALIVFLLILLSIVPIKITLNFLNKEKKELDKFFVIWIEQTFIIFLTMIFSMTLAMILNIFINTPTHEFFLNIYLFCICLAEIWITLRKKSRKTTIEKN